MAKDFENGRDSWRVFRIMAEFIEGFEMMARVDRAVTIFGSARTDPNDRYYRECEQTAKLLVKSRFAVITGGGPGIMEAGNKGAFDAGGQSVGLNITLPQEQEGNRYQTISLDFHYFYARKVMFTKYASAFICFPGGYGTLDEFFETMTLIQTLKIEPFPVILYGSDYWSGLVDWLKKTVQPHFIDREDTDIFKVVDSPQEAVRWIKAGVKKHWWKPLDEQLKQVAQQPATKTSTLAAHGAGNDTGEGTRYGQRPKPARGRHAKPSKKPQQ